MREPGYTKQLHAVGAAATLACHLQVSAQRDEVLAGPRQGQNLAVGPLDVRQDGLVEERGAQPKAWTSGAKERFRAWLEKNT